MNRWLRWTTRAGLGLSTWPTAAAAEVMDKETVPWSPGRLFAATAALGICVLLMVWAQRIRDRRRRWALALLAGTLAVLWASAGAFDDFYSADVGPAMRRELSAAQANAYAILLPIESAAPAVAVFLLTVFLPKARGAKPLPKEVSAR